MVHRDSLGYHQVIRPGEVNWMTAGSGITHSERFETMREQGGALHGIQAWVALPDAAEATAPAFVHFDAHELPEASGDDARVRIIAGSAFGLSSPVRTHSPLVYAHIEMRGGGSIVLPADYGERAVFVASGAVLIDGQRCEPGQMAVLAAGASDTVTAPEPATIMLLGGEPVGTRHIWWNFVASSEERIEQAKAGWRAGRFRLPAGDDAKFIPLPDEPSGRPPPAEPMS